MQQAIAKDEIHVDHHHFDQGAVVGLVLEGPLTITSEAHTLSDSQGIWPLPANVSAYNIELTDGSRALVPKDWIVIRTTPVMDDLSTEQAATLRQYAGLYGEGWKTRLMDEWRDGYRWHPKELETAYLQQIRNNFGPSWLGKVDITKDR